MSRAWNSKGRVKAIAFSLLLVSGCDNYSTAPTAERVTGTVNSADGVAIKYEVSGRGEPALVFVHCWTCNRGFWDEQVNHFSPHYTVVRLDLAGHGESGAARKVYSMDAFGADVAAVVAKLQLKQVILVGHSMGGPVSAAAETRLGSRVIGVVGVDTFYTGWDYPEGPQVAEFLKPFETDFVATTDKFIRSMFMPTADPARVDRVARIMTSADKTMAVNAMSEIFVWYARDSEAAFNRLGERLYNINANPNGDRKPLHERVVLVAGAGHFLPQERPDEFNRQLEKIVQRLTLQRSSY